MIATQCHQCGKPIQVRDDLAGKLVRCGACSGASAFERAVIERLDGICSRLSWALAILALPVISGVVWLVIVALARSVAPSGAP